MLNENLFIFWREFILYDENKSNFYAIRNNQLKNGDNNAQVFNGITSYFFIPTAEFPK